MMILYLLKYYIEAKLFFLLPDKYLKKVHLKRIKRQFEWAKNNSLFYQNIYEKEGMLDLEIGTLNDFAKLPVVDKELMRKYDLQDILTCPFTNDLVQVTTSGTNGIPFKIYSSKKEHFTSYVRTFMALTSYNPFKKFGLIGVYEQKEKVEKQTFLYQLQMRLRLFRRKTFDVYTPHKELVEKLENEKLGVLASSPSCLHALSEHMEKNKKKLNIKHVVVSGEMLAENMRTSIKKFFQTKITNVYGCMELPSLAWTKPDGEIYSYALNSVYLEYINPVEINGQMYGELVITNLLNRTMPFIRYKIGDHVRLQDIYKKMGAVDGRAEDQFILKDGRKIYMVLLFVFAKIQGVSQYRFIQKKSGDIHMEVVKKQSADVNMLCNKITQVWNKHFSNEYLKIEFKDELPVLSKSGKFKRLEKEV